MISILARRFRQALVFLGFDPVTIWAYRHLPRYLSDLRKFRRMGGSVTRLHPILSYFDTQNGVAEGHYFHQDLLVAQLIHENNPRRHFDVGSRIDGFVAHVASFRTIEVMDIRPQTISHKAIKFFQGDLLNLDSKFHGLYDSVSCLHSLEHFGLGRFGDPIHPEGHRIGLVNMAKMLQPGGTLYISFPIGESAVYFNAQRVFHPTEILTWTNLFTLRRFDWVDDQGQLHTRADPYSLPYVRRGCGIYTLTRH